MNQLALLGGRAAELTETVLEYSGTQSCVDLALKVKARVLE